MELAMMTVNKFDKKKWFIRFMGIVIFFLCSISLSDVGEPRPYYFDVIRGDVLRGLVNSLFLNVFLLCMIIKTPKGKLRYVMAFLLLLSGVGVFIIIPYGWTVASLALIFHLWLVYELISPRGLK